MKTLLKKFIKALQEWVNQSIPPDITYEEYMKNESKKIKYPLHWRF